MQILGILLLQFFESLFFYTFSDSGRFLNFKVKNAKLASFYT